MYTVTLYTYTHAQWIVMAQSSLMGALVSAALVVRLDTYDQIEIIRNYIERLDQYFTANDIPTSKQTSKLIMFVQLSLHIL